MNDNVLDFIGYLVDKTYEDADSREIFFKYKDTTNSLLLIGNRKEVEIPIAWEFFPVQLAKDLQQKALNFSLIFDKTPELKSILNDYFSGEFSYDNLLNYDFYEDELSQAA